LPARGGFLVEKKYEDRGIVLDFLIQGHPSDPRPIHLKEPIAQIIGDTFFTLLEVVPLKDVTLQPQEKVYIGKGERDKVDRIRRRIGYGDLTAAAKAELPKAVETLIDESPERFVEFFNRAGPLTTRFHQLELIPGVGKKLMWAILEEKKKGPFSDFADLERRVKGLTNPKSLIAKRIEMELQELDKYNIFVRPPSRRVSERGAGP
jgi:putative nucleotide binding protein